MENSIVCNGRSNVQLSNAATTSSNKGMLFICTSVTGFGTIIIPCTIYNTALKNVECCPK